MAGWVTPQLHHLISQSVGLVGWWGLLDWLATELHVITHSQAIVLLWPAQLVVVSPQVLKCCGM